MNPVLIIYALVLAIADQMLNVRLQTIIQLASADMAILEILNWDVLKVSIWFNTY